METATLTKTEEAHVERMSEESFSEPTMAERFQEFATRSISHSKKEEKENEKSYAPREISLKDRSDEEKDFIEKVGQRDESAKEPQKDAAKHAKQRPDATETKPAANT